MKKKLQKLFVVATKFMSRGLGLSRFKPISWLYNVIFLQLREVKKIAEISIPQVGDFKMYLDDKDSLHLSLFGIYEEFEVSLLPREIYEGNVVIDVGANIGYYTIIFSRLVGDKGVVYAFEPDPVNFEILKKNISLNNCTNVIAEQKALSNKSGKTSLYISGENRGDHRIYDPGDGREAIDIETVSLDDYLKDLTPRGIDFLKIDVQGAEVVVLEGANKILQKSKSVKILSEFWPSAIEKFGKNPSVFFSILSNFVLFDVNATKRTLTPIHDTDDFVAHCSQNANKDANIFAKR